MNISTYITELKKYQFLFEELIKRDFKKKYKRAVLGILWSMLSPLAMLLILSLIFGHFFGNRVQHYTIYLLAGQIIWGFFSDATNQGMSALYNNRGIFSKINIPKYLFVCSINISSLINFGLTFLLFLIFSLADGIMPTLKYIFLLFPVICLMLLNFGACLFLSSMYIFFRDTQYLYRIFLQLLMYGSAIFYTIDIVPGELQFIFYLNPIFIYISYFREIVVFDNIPTFEIQLLAIFYAILCLGIGIYTYCKSQNKFIYYI